MKRTFHCDELDTQHKLNELIIVQSYDSKWAKKLNIKSSYSNCSKEQQHCHCRTVSNKWSFSLLLLLIIFTSSKLKHNVNITDIFTTCLQMTSLMNNVLFKRHFVILRLINRRSIIFFAKFTLFTSFRKFLLTRSILRHRSIFLWLFIIKRL